MASESSLDESSSVKPAKDGVARIKPEFLAPEHKRTLSLEYLSEKDKKDLVTSEDGSSEPPKKKLRGQNKNRPRVARIPRSEKLCFFMLSDRECPYAKNCQYSHDAEGYLAKKPPDIGPECYLFNEYGKCKYGISCRFASSHISSDHKNIVNDKVWASKKDSPSMQNSMTRNELMCLRKREYDFSPAENAILEMQRYLAFKNKAKNLLDQAVSKSSDPVCSDSGADFLSTGDNSVLPINSKQVDAENCSSKNNCSQNVAVVPSCDNNNALAVQIKQEPGVENSCGQGVALVPSCDNNSAFPVKIKQEPGVENICDENVAVVPSCDVLHSAEPEISSASSVIKTVGPLTDEDCIKLRNPEVNKVDFHRKLYLAPLTTVGNLPFRRICKRFGADITCGEMAMSMNLVQGQQSEWALLRRHESEDVFGVQISGAHADIMTKCTQLILDNVDIDFIDINVGCPIDLVYNKGAGCGLMDRTRKFEQIVLAMKSIMSVPLTAKIRTGVHANKNTAHQLIPNLRQWGVSLTSIHGRSREQRYTKEADWNYIDHCAKLAHPMPLFGNGDVLSYEDYNLRLETTAVDGILLGRGPLFKPWIFTEIKEQRHWDISSQERFDIIKDYVHYGLDHWGADSEGVERTRRFLLEWLSFLYRYIPVGLLEQPPQRINERPPYFVGRNDLETLMASPNCADWIKISEMVLGPVPEGFSFLPKHKANSFR